MFNINVEFNEAGVTAAFNIYNIEGQLVRTLVDYETIDSDYILHWDGQTDNNNIAPNGVYILHVHAFKTDGWQKEYKIPLVLYYN